MKCGLGMWLASGSGTWRALRHSQEEGEDALAAGKVERGIGFPSKVEGYEQVLWDRLFY